MVRLLLKVYAFYEEGHVIMDSLLVPFHIIAFESTQLHQSYQKR